MSRAQDNDEPDDVAEKPCGCADEDVAPRRQSRFSAAWSVLWGEAIVPRDLYLDWLEYRVLFDDLLKRFGAQLARNAKAEHARIRKSLDVEQPTHRDIAAMSSGKARVRAIMAARRGFQPKVRPPSVMPELPEIEENAS